MGSLLTHIGLHGVCGTGMEWSGFRTRRQGPLASFARVRFGGEVAFQRRECGQSLMSLAARGSKKGQGLCIVAS